MHLVETYALSCGLQIDKPSIYESYTPLPRDTDKYIALQGVGGAPSREYNLWSEVTDILRSIFNEEGISIVQIGGTKEEKINGTLDMRGRTTINQAAYIIKNSLLHLGVDSFGIHVASGYNKKIVGIYSNMLPSECGPYWSEDKDTILISSVREGEKPSYAMYEDPQTMNRIKPEKIAKSVCDLLGLEFNYPYRTVYVGEEYHLSRIEVVPTHTILNWRDLEVESLIIRMDKYFDQKILSQQLSLCQCSIITDKPIDLRIIRNFKSRITELVYFVDEETDVNYIKQLKESGVKLFILSKLNEERLNKIKLDYVEIAPVMPKPDSKKSLAEDELKGVDMKNLYYRSSFSIIKSEKIYKSYADTHESAEVQSVKRGIPPRKVVDHPDFWKDLDRMILLEKKDDPGADK